MQLRRLAYVALLIGLGSATFQCGALAAEHTIDPHAFGEPLEQFEARHVCAYGTLTHRYANPAEACLDADGRTQRQTDARSEMSIAAAAPSPQSRKRSADGRSVR